MNCKQCYRMPICGIWIYQGGVGVPCRHFLATAEVERMRLERENKSKESK